MSDSVHLDYTHGTGARTCSRSYNDRFPFTGRPLGPGVCTFRMSTIIVGVAGSSIIMRISIVVCTRY